MNREELNERLRRIQATQAELEKVDRGCRGCIKFFGGSHCEKYGQVPTNFVSQGCNEWDFEDCPF